MSNLMQVENWRPAYAALREVGMKDADIAALAGVSRAVINSVANGNYPRKHHLAFNGGFRVLTKLKELKANGQLPNFSFDSLRVSESDNQRPEGNGQGVGAVGAARTA